MSTMLESLFGLGEVREPLEEGQKEVIFSCDKPYGVLSVCKVSDSDYRVFVDDEENAWFTLPEDKESLKQYLLYKKDIPEDQLGFLKEI